MAIDAVSGTFIRSLNCNEGKARFDGRVKKLVKHKPVPEKPE